MANIRDGKRLETEIVLSAVSVLNALIVASTFMEMLTDSQATKMEKKFVLLKVMT